LAIVFYLYNAVNDSKNVELSWRDLLLAVRCEYWARGVSRLHGSVSIPIEVIG
jgi:hypothetical protein